jgi:hypothetical protein
MVDNRRRSDTSGLDTVSVGNPHRHVARLLLLYTAASVTVRFDASTSIYGYREATNNYCPLRNFSHPTNQKPLFFCDITVFIIVDVVVGIRSRIGVPFVAVASTIYQVRSSESTTRILSATRGNPSFHAMMRPLYFFFPASCRHDFFFGSCARSGQVSLWALLGTPTTRLVNSMDIDKV